MSKREKLENKIRNLQSIRFEEAVKVLEWNNFHKSFSKGSHFQFKNENNKSFTLAKPHGKENELPEYALKNLKRLLNL